MNYLYHVTIVLLSGFIILMGCNSDEDQKPEDLNNDRNPSANTPSTITSQQLLSASLEGNLKYVQKAIKQDFNIDESDQSGRTPLMLASYNGHYEVVQLLLKNEADPNATDNQGRAPLAFAASGPFPKTAELLLENGADPDRTDKKEGWTALMWAAAEGNEQVVRTLLDHGADPTLEDKDNETAHDFASDNGHNKVAELLKQAENRK